MGAAGGAAAVFLMELLVVRQRRRREEVRELRRVQFALIRRYATLHMLWNQWLKDANPSKMGPFYWLVLQPPFVLVPSPPLNLEGIGFVTEDAPNLINEILRDEENFEVVLHLVREFSANRNQMSERVEKWERETGSAAVEGIPVEVIVNLAGPRLLEVQRKFVDTLLVKIPELREIFFRRAEEVGTYVAEHYGTRPLRMERLPDNGTPVIDLPRHG
jgi:hypothetical protein